MSCDLSAGRLINCQDTVGGLRRVFISSTYSDNVLGNISETNLIISDSGAADWSGASSSVVQLMQYDLIPDKSSLTVAVNQEASGGATVYTQTLTVALHNLEQADLMEIFNMGQNRFQVYVLDANENVFLLGAEYGMVLSGGDTFSLGTARTDTPTITLELTSQERVPMYTVTATSGSAQTGYPLDGLTDTAEYNIVVGA